jgi:hypothetical protein
MRMPAAWNARRAIRANQRPTLIVVDSFGNGALSSQVDATVLGALTTGDPNQHGYHVTGIAAANFANNGSPAGRVTGVFPSTSLLKVVDVVGLTLDAAGLRMRQAVTATPGRVVVNSSLGHQTPTTEAYAQQEGSDWAIDVRSAGFVNRMLHAASAGNSAAPATANSPWVSAALRSDLTDIGGLPAPALRNTLAVENLADTGAPAYESGCLGISSNRGGNLAAVGTNVFSHLLSPSAGDLTGTSMSSPQAAGLAEYLWSIAPDLTAPQLASAMIATGRPPLAITPGPCGSNVPSAPRLDAYAAVLSLDQPAAVTRATAPVRFAILDHNGDGAFDHRDIQAFVSAYRNPPSARNWSRADLNGDGFTGSSRPAALDLDPRGSTRAAAPSLGTVGATIEGFPLTFDERALTDAEVLCFYAYSGLYTGTDLQRRHDELETEDTCNLPGDVRLELDFPERVRRGQSNTLTVRAFKVDGTGSEVDQQGVHLELSASGGTIGAASGTTDAQGEFTTTATMAQNQSSITIDVTAFDHPGGDELADDSVTAQLLTDGSAVLDSVFAHIFVRGQPEDDDKDADTPNWTLTGASSGPGGNASVTASATYTQDGPTVRYTGFAELEAHAGSDPAGATAGYTSSLQVTVTGGPVGWRVQQRFVGTRPLSNFDFGCQVWLGTQRVSSTGSAGGILEEGTSTISHDCGGGVGQPPADPTIDGRVDFTVTIGP